MSSHPPAVNDNPPNSYLINGVTYEVHPVALLLPLPAEDSPAFLAMVEDVRENGLREPVYVRGTTLVDGRTRARAAELAGQAIRVEEIPASTIIPVFVASVNIHRRHLTEDQRAGIAASFVKLIEAQRREAQRLSRHLRKGRAATRAEDDSSAASREALSPDASASGNGVSSASPPSESAGEASAAGGGADSGAAAPPAAEASAVVASPAEPEPPDPPERVSLKDAAAQMNTSRKLTRRASAVIGKDPKFEAPIRAGFLKVIDAEKLLKRDDDVRDRVLELIADPSCSFQQALDTALGRAPRPSGRKPPGPPKTSAPPPPAAGSSGLPGLPPMPGEGGPAAVADGPAASAQAAPSAASVPASGSDAPAAVSGAARTPAPPAIHFGPDRAAPSPHLGSPTDVLDSVRLLFGRIDLDPCSSDDAQQRVGAATWFTDKDDPFHDPWTGSVYLFPPVDDDHLQRFSTRLLSELEGHRVPAAALLAPLDLRDRWALSCVRHSTFRGLVVARELPSFPVPGADPWTPGYPFAVYLFGDPVDPAGVEAAFAHWGDILFVRREGA